MNSGGNSWLPPSAHGNLLSDTVRPAEGKRWTTTLQQPPLAQGDSLPTTDLKPPPSSHHQWTPHTLGCRIGTLNYWLHRGRERATFLNQQEHIPGLLRRPNWALRPDTFNHLATQRENPCPTVGRCACKTPLCRPRPPYMCPTHLSGVPSASLFLNSKLL